MKKKSKSASSICGQTRIERPHDNQAPAYCHGDLLQSALKDSSDVAGNFCSNELMSKKNTSSGTDYKLRV